MPWSIPHVLLLVSCLLMGFMCCIGKKHREYELQYDDTDLREELDSFWFDATQFLLRSVQEIIQLRSVKAHELL